MKTPLLLASLLLLLPPGLRGDTPPGTRTNPADRSRVLIVRPVILCDDDGSHPARHALPKTLVDQVYSAADLEVIYLDPVPWSHGRARRGEINLDTIVAEGRGNGMVTADPGIVTLLFVSAVDGNPGPLGRGMQGGNICFISLGPPEKMRTPAERAFVIAHEIGHCLGMIHAVDDPAVPTDIPNLQGDGPFEQRLTPAALHPSQVPTILASPLVLPRIRFHSRNKAARLLSDDAWANKPNSLEPDSLRFQLGLPPDTPLPDKPADYAAFARQGFSEIAEDFTAQEKDTIRLRIERLNQLIDRRWPLLTRLPWHFIKAKPGFCAGMPHTRGLSTILTASRIKRFADDESHALEILLHEKLHILQRLSPNRFASTFRRYGFKPVPLAPGESSRLKLIRNPDAPPPHWALQHDGQLLLVASTLKPREDRFTFVPRFHPLVATTLGYAALPAIDEPPAIKDWRKTLPIHNGFDDPREINAYLLGRIFHVDLLNSAHDNLTPGQLGILAEERDKLPELLRLCPTDAASN